MRRCVLLAILLLSACVGAARAAVADTFVASSNHWSRNGAAFGGFSISTDPVLMPKTEVLRRDPSGLAENVLTPRSLLFRDMSMPFNFSRVGSCIALAISSLIVGCGGGGGGADDGIVQASVTSSSAANSTAGAATSSASTDASSGTDATSASDAAASAASDINATTAGSQARRVVAINKKSGLGMNLTGISYYSGQYPTIDLMKKADPWLTQCATWMSSSCKSSTFDSGEEAQLDLDANGWVRSLPANDSPLVYRYASTVVVSDDAHPVGKYIVKYDGQGTLVYGGVASKVDAESTPGRDVVNVVAGSNIFLLSVMATTPSNYLRNIRVYPPGGACANDLMTWVTSASSCNASTGAYVAFENFPATSTWFPSFLKDLKGFRTLRFMDWVNTNSNTSVSWSDRPSITKRAWAGAAGVPYESLFDLSRTLGADPWIALPPYVNDDYIHQFGKLAHQLLASGLTLNLEYGNEMWNYSFPATGWALGQAKTTYATALAGGANQYELQRNWYAQRLVQACNIVKGEFGADASRVRCIANVQNGNAYDVDQLMTCPYAGGNCAKSIDVIAVAPYFAGYLSDAANLPTIASWYASSDGGLDQVFQEIIGTDSAATAAALTPLATTSQTPGGALTSLKTLAKLTKAAAAKYGKPMWAYEGGQGMTPPMGSTDQDLLALMIAANRDARMGAAYQTMLQDWVSAGGQTFALFNDVSPYTKWGFWGLRESQFATTANSPKWNTAVQWRDSTPCWWSGC